jgi:hypothetical protein
MPNILIFSLLMLYISVSTSYIRFVSISPKFSLLNLRDKGLNTNLKLLKSNKIVEQAALIHLTQLDMIKRTDRLGGTKETKGSESTESTDSSDGYLNNLNIQGFVNANISSIIKNTKYNCTQDILLTGEQINITSIYLNIDKVKGVYFAKDVKNVIFTLPEILSDLYYYDCNDGNDIKSGVIYKISNNTRINMKGLDRFVFQKFNNNNIGGILF